MPRAHDAGTVMEGFGTISLPGSRERVPEEESSVLSMPIDWDLYRLRVRHLRKELGFRRAKDFVDFIYLRTRMDLGVDAYYRWERGDATPKFTNLDYVFAINLAVYGTLMPAELMDGCIDPYWVEIEDHDGLLPEEWRIENYFAALEAYKFDTDRPTAEEVAAVAGGTKYDYMDPDQPFYRED